METQGFISGLEAYIQNHSGHILRPPPPENPVPGRWRKIYWIGVGSKSSGLHTKKEFLAIMRKIHAEHIYRRRRGDRFIPQGKIKHNDIDSWLAFTNAIYI
jgi:hypothetical protein